MVLETGKKTKNTTIGGKRISAPVVGGKLKGNRMSKNGKKVVVKQLVNVESSKKLEDTGFGSQGKTVGHELLEGNYVAIQNPGAG